MFGNSLLAQFDINYTFSFKFKLKGKHGKSFHLFIQSSYKRKFCKTITLKRVLMEEILKMFIFYKHSFSIFRVCPIDQPPALALKKGLYLQFVYIKSKTNGHNPPLKNVKDL